MVLIILLASTAVPGTPSPAYARAVIAGLACSLVGDVLLMLPQRPFRPGVLAFLVAHLFYTWAFWTAVPGRLTGADTATGTLVALAGITLFRRLAAGMREQGEAKLVGPAALYLFAISLMVWRGLGTLFQAGSLPFRPVLVAAGAILFYISDAALTWDRFIRPLPLRHIIVMGTYFTAQYCFALSVAWPPAPAD